MDTRLDKLVSYSLRVGEEIIDLNSWIGSEISIEFSGKINCVACDVITPKSYGGGYCYNCLTSLPEADSCQVKPEECHHHKGTCRDPEWGEKYCMQPHKVYLARSSDVKVGITRENPTEIRWMDQGAIEGMVIAEVPSRLISGLVEVSIAKYIEDKTNFRKMLAGEVSPEDLDEVFERIVDKVPAKLHDYLLHKRQKVSIKYPVTQHPTTVKAASLDKEPNLQGKLTGIKGQYMIFEDFVFNVRSHSGYEVKLSGCAAEEPLKLEKKKEKKEEQPVDLFDFMG